ncbi:MAG: SAVED domain-containing protein [Archangium sp.]
MTVNKVAPNLGRATFVIQSTLTAISSQDVELAIEPATSSLGSAIVRLDSRLDLRELSALDWGRLHDRLLTEISEKLSGPLKENDGAIVYFGMTPIAVAMELGSRIGLARRVLVFQQRHDTQTWRWATDQLTVRVDLHGVPTQQVFAKGDVILRVSCSHHVDIESTRTAVPERLGELDVVVDHVDEDVLQSQADVDCVARCFGGALDAIRRWYPNADTIHVFAAVPAGLAFRLGCEINPTIHRPVQTYQFNGRGEPKQVKALVLGDEPAGNLDDQAKQRAGEVRKLFGIALGQLHLLSGLPAAARWLDSVLNCDTSVLPPSIHLLGAPSPSAALFESKISDRRDADGEFKFLTDAREWVFDDRLLAAIGARLEGRSVELAARLFLLHEAVHIKQQNITTSSAAGVGMLPRVLEDADYVADVWAVLHELGRSLHSGEKQSAELTLHAQEIVRTMTSIFWAFDAGSGPLREIQVRRLNRYLLWHWQRLRLEAARDFSSVLRVLSEKPVLEISGPRVFVARGRVLFDLDPLHFRDLEFGVLVEGCRVVRIGNREGASSSRLLAQLRGRNELGFLEALRGIFDAAQPPGRTH